jgi:hypothetical protein
LQLANSSRLRETSLTCWEFRSRNWQDLTLTRTESNGRVQEAALRAMTNSLLPAVMYPSEIT